MRVSSLPLLAATAAAQQVAAPWGQCGGMGFVGPLSCGTGYYCNVYNPYYAQCIPGVQSIPIRTSTPASTSAPGPTTTSTPTTLTTITTAAITSTPPVNPGTGSPTTLLPGNFWIRAVASPNYRSYLQPAPTSVPLSIPAVLASSKTAAQFRSVGNQLAVQFPGSSSVMYMHVANSTTPTPRTLRTWFAAEKNTNGDFAFQGDTLVWSVAGMQRPNNAAWLVCGGGQQPEVFVNTGAFLYQTPEGCFDHTIHSYGGATADV